MQSVEFRDVEVLDDAVPGLRCLIATKQVIIPECLLEPGTTVRRAGDRGTLVIPRWLGIGLGLVWPFPKAPAEPAMPEASRRRLPASRALSSQKREAAAS